MSFDIKYSGKVSVRAEDPALLAAPVVGVLLIGVVVGGVGGVLREELKSLAIGESNTGNHTVLAATKDVSIDLFDLAARREKIGVLPAK